MKLSKLLILGATCLSLVACGPSNDGNDKQDTRTIVDAIGRKVEIKAKPESYVCLGPGCLRQYAYVADTSKLVGIEKNEQTAPRNTKPYMYRIDNYMELPVIGQGGPNKSSINKEALVQANPDIIFTSYNSDKAYLDDLAKQTGLAVVAVGYNSNGLFAQDIYDSLKLIGNITGFETRANEVVEYFSNSKKELMEKAAVNPTDKRAYVGCVNHRGSFGIESTTGDFPIFDVLGIKNVINEKGITDFKQIDKEVLIDLQPDFMIMDAGGLSILKEDMATHPDYYKSLNAFKNDEVYIELPFVFYSNNFDIALADAYYIASVVYPEQFKDFNIKDKFNEITEFLVGKGVYNEVSSHFGEYGKLDVNSLLK